LFEPGNASDLAEKMKRVIQSPDLVEAFKRNIKKQKTMEDHAQDMIELYDRLLMSSDTATRKLNLSYHSAEKLWKG